MKGRDICQQVVLITYVRMSLLMTKMVIGSINYQDRPNIIHLSKLKRIKVGSCQEI